MFTRFLEHYFGKNITNLQIPHKINQQSINNFTRYVSQPYAKVKSCIVEEIMKDEDTFYEYKAKMKLFKEFFPERMNMYLNVIPDFVKQYKDGVFDKYQFASIVEFSDKILTDKKICSNAYIEKIQTMLNILNTKNNTEDDQNILRSILERKICNKVSIYYTYNKLLEQQNLSDKFSLRIIGERNLMLDKAIMCKIVNERVEEGRVGRVEDFPVISIIDILNVDMLTKFIKNDVITAEDMVLQIQNFEIDVLHKDKLMEALDDL